MILRKLTAAVIASTFVTSGAWAQTDTADTIVNLTITEQFEVDAISALNFADNATLDPATGKITGDSGLCTWSNSEFQLVVSSANSWVLSGADSGNADTISYELRTGSDAAAGSVLSGTGPFTPNNSDIFNSSVRCASDSPATSDYVALTAVLTENTTLKASDSYSDTVTFTIQSI